ncbi:MAG: imidazole glycerol phosphate synthase subunit HisH [Thiotrichales bacterium]|nr:MAG: imidazole glycerol phosphate synthase subunit HisH [Thiotrichales bacterium]
MSLIAVVDYGMGNLRSVDKALEHVATSGQRVCVTSDAGEIASAERVVFPGQGAARDCMRELKDRNLIEPVMQAAREKPFLGICMGLQVLMSRSEENDGVDCMDLFKGGVRYFGSELDRDNSEELLKIPHMGWNNVTQTISHPLWHGIKQGSRFYFVHSYFVDPEDEAVVAGETTYEIVFTSAIACDNVFAVQFHPEKSAADGLQLLKNFTQWDGK